MSSGMGASGADGGSGATGDPRPTRVPLHRGVSRIFIATKTSYSANFMRQSSGAPMVPPI